MVFRQFNLPGAYNCYHRTILSENSIEKKALNTSVRQQLQHTLDEMVSGKKKKTTTISLQAENLKPPKNSNKISNTAVARKVKRKNNAL